MKRTFLLALAFILTSGVNAQVHKYIDNRYDDGNTNGSSITGTTSNARFDSDAFSATVVDKTYNPVPTYIYVESEYRKYTIGAVDYKFKRWNPYDSCYRIRRQVRPNSTRAENFYAMADTIVNARIQAIYLDDPNASKIIPGAINLFQIKDPWSFSGQTQDTLPHNVTLPYEFEDDPATYGVFLNTAGYLPDIRYPYYSVRMPYVMNWNGSTWDMGRPHNCFVATYDLPSAGSLVLADWYLNPVSTSVFLTDPNETSYTAACAYLTKAIDFKTANAVDTLYVEYKSHLCSNKTVNTTDESGPTAPNSQRKVDGQGEPYAAVYESADEVWLLTEGPDWAEEVRLSAGNKSAKRPSIVRSIGPSLAGVLAYTWYENNTIKAGYDSSGTPIILPEGGYQPTSTASPVIAVYTSPTLHTLIVYETANGLGYLSYRQSALMTYGIIPTTNSSSECPTIAYAGDTTKFHLAWKQGDIIKYMKVYMDGNGNLQVFENLDFVNPQGKVASGPPSIAPYRGYESQQYPYDAVVAFECSQDNSREIAIAFKARGATGVSNPILISPPPEEYYWAPSVSAWNVWQLNAAKSHVRCAFNHTTASSTDVEIVVAQLTNDVITTSVQNTDGLHPSTVAFIDSGDGFEVYSQLIDMNDYTISRIGTSTSYLNKPCTDTKIVTPGSTSILLENYPNPFNPTTEIRYYLPNEEHITLKVFSAIGAEIKVLDQGSRAAGWHSVTFDASNLSAGTYLYQLTSHSGIVANQMILLK